MRHDTLIIGAGPAAMAAGYECQRRGLRTRLVERADRPVPSWRGRHDQLHLNTHRRYSHLPGLPIPKRCGAFPSRDDYVEYLERYLEWSGLDVEFGTTALRVDRVDGGWRVETDRGPREAAHVIVATGSDRIPWTPDWPGRDRFAGRIMHAADFRHAGDHVGQRVLLVGAGNSGVDIANHLAAVDIGPSWVSVRNGPHIMPHRLLGVPTQPLTVHMRPLPTALKDWIIAAICRLGCGDLARLGMPRPPRGPATRQLEEGVVPAVDNGFVAALRAGRFHVVPEISSFDADRVRLVNGDSIRPDVVICATGYRLGLEPLVGHLGVLRPDGRPRFVADRGDPDFPGLWFFGQNASMRTGMHLRCEEARRLAERIARERASAAGEARDEAPKPPTARETG